MSESRCVICEARAGKDSITIEKRGLVFCSTYCMLEYDDISTNLERTRSKAHQGPDRRKAYDDRVSK